MTDHVKTEIANGVLTITLQRPAKKNGGTESENKLADYGRAQHEPKGNQQRIPEFSVRQQPQVIADPHKARVGRRHADQRSIRQTQIDRVKRRIDYQRAD